MQTLNKQAARERHNRCDAARHPTWARVAKREHNKCDAKSHLMRHTKEDTMGRKSRNTNTKVRKTLAIQVGS